MKTRRIHLSNGCGLVAAALAAFLALAGTAAAQAPALMTINNHNGPAPDVVRAQGLEAQAVALCSEFEGKGTALRIARLYEEAASLRAEDDPKRVDDLYLAAAMYKHAGKLDAALRDVTAAAELALMNGRVVDAAHMFVTAATVAQEARKPETVVQLAHRAEMLCNCPMMDPGTAAGIHQRIAHSGRVLVVRR